jgi:quercetin dioxygenase-like cupin family protein
MNLPASPVSARVRHADPAGYVGALPGILRKTLVDGGRTQLVEFKLEKNAVIPAHDHPQEQTGYLASGRIILNIAGVDHEMRPGDAWTIPGGIEHRATILDDSVAVEVFSPGRPDYRG